MIDLTLKKLDASYARELSVLENGCFSCPWSEEGFIDGLNNDRFYFIGLFEGDDLIGYGSLATILDEGDIARIAVRSDKRGMGCGKMIVCDLENEARSRGVVYLHLEVREGNAPARHLYEKVGFTSDGIRKNYYQKPLENAVLMTKKL